MAGESPLPNVSQEWFCRKLLENNGNQSKAYAAAYPNASPSTIAVESSRILDREPIQDRLNHLLETEYARDEDLARDFHSFRQANKAIYHNGVKVGEEPDWQARISGVDKILKLRGKLSDSQIKIDARQVHNYAGNNSESARAMLEILQEMKQIREEIKRDKLTMSSEPLAAQGLEQSEQSSVNKK